MMPNLFPAAHASFGNQINNAMQSMWSVNQANQQQAGRGGGGAPSYSSPSGRPASIAGMGEDSYAPLRQAKMAADARSIGMRGQVNDAVYAMRQPELRGAFSAMFGSPFMGQGGYSPTPLPTQFNTNYGAFGSFLNPNGQ